MSESILKLEQPKADSSNINKYITLNAIISLNDATALEKLVELQKRLKPSNTKYSETVGSGIYRYPEETIHFSIINFENLMSEGSNREYLRTNQYCDEHAKLHQVQIENIGEICNRFFKEQNINEHDCIFLMKWIYTPSSASICIQTFPSPRLMQIFTNLADRLNLISEPRIKANPNYCDKTVNFAFGTNILRFFRVPRKKSLLILGKWLLSLIKVRVLILT